MTTRSTVLAATYVFPGDLVVDLSDGTIQIVVSRIINHKLPFSESVFDFGLLGLGYDPAITHSFFMMRVIVP